ncbi:BNR-4 repeat-containing protein [Actinoplanes sp. CA-051413]|uniref:BNR-4 repeat-containing protein n=1 Tax=Actinoplanes sp. CA-051413 TaxID=3239899 RepID=UPI003D997ADD
MRTVIAFVSVLAVATPAQAVPPRPDLMTPVTAVAARSDRRPVAGGVHDAAVGRTFISWAGQYEDNYVQSYEHRTGTWSDPVRVAGGDNDSHNYPTMIQAADGHLLVFRGLHNRELWVARSPRPHSIEGTWTDVNIAEGLGATYPMPFRTADGTIFVFFRETAGDFDPAFPTDTRPMKYVRSTDDGRTWQSSTTLTGDRWAIAPLNRPDNMNEIYLGQLRYEPATLLHRERVGIVYTLAGGGPEGHLHDRYHRNIYYTAFDPGSLTFRSAAGRSLGTSIDDADQEAHLKVVETPLQTVNPRSPDYINLVGTTLGVAPFVVWMQLDAAGVVHTHTGTWAGLGGWRTREVATGVRVRDMEPAGPASWRIYATPADGTPGIGVYRLTAGSFWRYETTIATPKPVQRIEVIDGRRDPAWILATGASSARDVAVADGDIYVAGRPRP